MNGKLIITKLNIENQDRIFSGLYNENGFYQVRFSSLEEKPENCNVGDIYIGKVKDIVKNINAAFIEFAKGSIGYFSIEENDNPIFLNNKKNNRLCVGDEIIVQISKSAVKSKFPVLTSKISLTGRYLVLNIGKTGIGFSNKIKLVEFKNKIKEIIEEVKNLIEDEDEKYGIIVRTNAIEADEKLLKQELESLFDKWKNIKKIGKTRTCFTKLMEAELDYLKMIKGAYFSEIEEIITDDIEIYNQVLIYVKSNSYELKVRLYNDELLPLSKLYSIEKTLKNIFSKNVWLKSGAYLVIEYTEAMTVIDVNTGKFIKGKDTEEAILKVNLEAAVEIIKQLQLRNISGIIMVDFINMEKNENKLLLLKKLYELAINDKTKTNIIDYTKLGLVEITRKKIDAPICEQIKH